ncbi:MAG: ribonuclease III [Pseudomonadota bacterium]
MRLATQRLFSALDYELDNDALLRHAFRHRSAAGPSNERLEFLGDAVLDTVISAALYRKFADADEGVLSRLRASLVKDRALADVARQLQLGDLLQLGSGELKSGGLRRDSILSDALEALFGAIFLHAGYASAERVILHVFDAQLSALALTDAEKDAKTALQEWLQARGHDLPNYALVSAQGPDHARVFTVRCHTVAPAASAEAQGGSRRIAEQRAAYDVLRQISGALT